MNVFRYGFRAEDLRGVCRLSCFVRAILRVKRKRVAAAHLTDAQHAAAAIIKIDVPFPNLEAQRIIAQCQFENRSKLAAFQIGNERIINSSANETIHRFTLLHNLIV
ncbi:MAG: hypothetical protein ACOYI5_04780 [Christensenellales bacterium]